ncbi:hypothetical protein FKW77_000241 [Venturia effusa]|uniref:T6SS Phospholipase effector Tle1-like catalytic domain-containing protein n=1 Tax=Venturia effusa TaxID=50376 RepID=A0A517LPF2_9PEZI|nr:hypothetical protein FKW77_000241 [Venturia effusa]
MATTPNIERKPRKIIIACDGTWMNSDLGWEKASLWDRLTKGIKGHPVNPSNVTRICRATRPEDDEGHPQIVYYQNGIGSSWSIVDKLLGGALAMGLSDNIRAAYAFLVNNYMDHDLIYFLGYSRGAFTARSTAGMVAKFGLLNKSTMRCFYEIFEDWEGAGEKGYHPQGPQALLDAGLITQEEFKDFKEMLPTSDAGGCPDAYLDCYAQKLKDFKLNRDVQITAIGVWDTVGSLGLPIAPWLQKIGFSPSLRKYRFYDTAISNDVLNAFQALALDEHRSAFSPTLWEKPEGNNTKLKQVWFPGVHSNIGGGCVDTGMSDITLAWMMSQLATLSTDNPKTNMMNIAFTRQPQDYLLGEVSADKAHYPNKKTIPRPWAWGLGDLINSFTFPASIIGKHTRTPKAYYRLKYDSGKPTGNLLVNTNEYLHASVRARMLLHGKNYDLKTQYFPTALGTPSFDAEHNLVDEWVTATHNQKTLLYRDTGLEEDELGVFEHEIMDEATRKTLSDHRFEVSHRTPH